MYVVTACRLTGLQPFTILYNLLEISCNLFNFTCNFYRKFLKNSL